MTQPFLSPITLRSGHTLPNRLVVAAMTNQQSNPDGTLHERELRWLVARAEGGFGCVTTCAAHVHPDGQGWPGELGVFGDQHLPGLERLSGALRDHGAHGWVQLFHGGVRAPESLIGEQPWSATAFTPSPETIEPPREASSDDIQRTIDAFAAAAKRCEQAGFEGVELHGAHGYLLCQFLGAISNARSDAWGGSFENRLRFPFAVYDAVRAATSDSFTVGIRLSPEINTLGVTVPESLETASRFAARGADFIHISLWDAFQRHADYPERPLTTLFRDAVPADCALISTGGIWTPEQAGQIMAEGADMVGLGRAAIGNPDWPIRAQQPQYQPDRPPYTEAHLRQAALSDRFIDYMRRWKNFVMEEDR